MQVPIIGYTPETGPGAAAPTLPDLLIPLEDLKTYLGIGDGSQDALLNQHGLVVTQMLRTYLGRLINHVDMNVELRDVCGAYVMLPNPTIWGIDTVTIDGSAVAEWQFNSASGRLAFPSRGNLHDAIVYVEYQGGFDPIPQPIIDTYAKMINARLGAGAGEMVTGGLLKAITVFDSHREEYATGSTYGASSAFSGEIEPYKADLEPYIYHHELVT